MADPTQPMLKPPLLLGGALALGCLLSAILPVGPGLGTGNAPAMAVGSLFVLLGFILAFFAARSIFEVTRGRAPEDTQPVLVTEGPYRFTRNPIYIGLVLIYFGLSIVLTSIWVLALLIPVLILLQRNIVPAEEAELEAEFGDTYRKYKARVPRWV